MTQSMVLSVPAPYGGTVDDRQDGNCVLIVPNATLTARTQNECVPPLAGTENSKPW